MIHESLRSCLFSVNDFAEVNKLEIFVVEKMFPDKTRFEYIKTETDEDKIECYKIYRIYTKDYQQTDDACVVCICSESHSTLKAYKVADYFTHDYSYIQKAHLLARLFNIDKFYIATKLLNNPARFYDFYCVQEYYKNLSVVHKNIKKKLHDCKENNNDKEIRYLKYILGEDMYQKLYIDSLSPDELKEIFDYFYKTINKKEVSEEGETASRIASCISDIIIIALLKNKSLKIELFDV